MGKQHPSELKALARLCKRAADLQREINSIELDLKNKKEELSTLNDKEIPDFMSEIGWATAKLASGETVEIVPVVRAHISKDRAPDAHKWIAEQGAGDLIDNVVSVRFAKGEDEKATDLYEKLLNQGEQVERKQSIHWARLRRFVKERLEQGLPLEKQLLGVYIGSTTKITNPKED